MPNITIRTQAEFDSLPESFEEATRIIIRNNPTAGRIIVLGNRGNASVEARDNASVEARDNASVVARDNASVKVYDNASILAQDNVSVLAQDNASVVAQYNASVEARDNASVEARDNASVVARGNASVKAYGNASVQAQDNASVEARGNSSVKAYDNSSVAAYHQTAIRRYSAESKITLHDSSVCWDMNSYPVNISSFAKFSKHINPVIAVATTAKLTEDQKNELLDQYSPCQNRWMKRAKVLKKFLEDTVIPIFLSNKRNME